MPPATHDPSGMRLVDRLLVLAVAAVLVLGVGRAPWHLMRYLLNAEGAPGLKSALPYIAQWWGPRELPHRGDDYLTVLERRGTVEAANEVVGALLLRHLVTGGQGVALIIPDDLGLMSADVLRLTLDRADGSRIEKEVPVFDEERVRRVSPLPVSVEDYDPALTKHDAASLPRQVIQLVYPHGEARLYPAEDDPDTVFVLHTDSERRLILLVPLEYSPLGASR